MNQEDTGLGFWNSLPVLAKVGDDSEKLAAVSLCELSYIVY